jgi:hypothetical protein
LGLGDRKESNQHRRKAKKEMFYHV